MDKLESILLTSGEASNKEEARWREDLPSLYFSMGRAARRKNEFCDLTIRNDTIPRLSERIDAENTNTTK